MLRKTRDPRWNEEFQFTLEEPPLKESIRVEVMGKGTGFHFRSKVKKKIFYVLCLDQSLLMFLFGFNSLSWHDV